MAIYSWMISFSDLTDEVVKKPGDNWLQIHPDPTNNYYALTAAKFINYAASFGIDATTLSQLDRITNPPHYLVIQWLITCLQMLVSQNLIGVNNDSMIEDKWKYKYQMYRDDLKTLSTKVRYETILTGVMQQNYTRYAGTFDIMV